MIKACHDKTIFQALVNHSTAFSAKIDTAISALVHEVAYAFRWLAKIDDGLEARNISQVSRLVVAVVQSEAMLVGLMAHGLDESRPCQCLIKIGNAVTLKALILG